MSVYDNVADTARLDLIPFDDNVSEAIHSLIANFIQMDGQLRCNVVDSIIDVVKQRRAEIVVVENEYVDADYLETYSQHYSKAFKEKKRYCIRLHFFSKYLSLEELFELNDIFKEAYLGYCILRPTGQQYVSRTVISPPHGQSSGDQFMPVRGRFRTHLLGHRLSVSGAPFIQQDANTFICAGAAIWSVAQFMHAVHKTPRYFPAQITNIARKSFSHGQIRKGFKAEQIVMALQQMELNPHVDFRSGLHELRKTDPESHRAEIARLTALIHVFVDSAFPPILAYTTTDGGGHAVSVVGHDIVERKFKPDEIDALYGGVLGNSYFVNKFYVMDDARGPYAEFAIDDNGHPDIPCLSCCDLIAIIAPMPPEVTLEYDDAVMELNKLANFWNGFLDYLRLDDQGLNPNEYKINNSEHTSIVIRPALLDSRVWKRQVLKRRTPKWLRLQYQALLLPKYIWVLEISDFDKTNHRDVEDRKIIGEAILDATANPHWPMDSWLSFHVKGLFIDVDGHIALSPDSFEPYNPLRRTDES